MTTKQEVLYGGASIVIVVVLWEIFVDLTHVPLVILPSPRDIYTMGILPYASILPTHTFITLEETILGFVLAAAIALVLAIGIYHSRVVSSFVYPLLVLIQDIPKVALAPLMVVWFGFGIGNKVVLVFLMSFFPIVIGALLGFKDTPKEILDLAEASRVGRAKRFRLVVFPWSLPHIYGGLKVGITIAIVGAIVGEFVESAGGLGYLILQAQYSIQTPLMFAAILIASALGGILYGVILLLERVTLGWYVQMRRGR